MEEYDFQLRVTKKEDARKDKEEKEFVFTVDL